MANGYAEYNQVADALMPFKTLMKPELAKLQIRNSVDVSSKVEQ